MDFPMQVPVLKMELQGMKQGIMVALNRSHDEIERAVEEQLQKVIAEFDFAAIVREHMRSALDKAVREALDSAVRHTFWDPEVAAAFEKYARPFALECAQKFMQVIRPPEVDDEA